MIRTPGQPARRGQVIDAGHEVTVIQVLEDTVGLPPARTVIVLTGDVRDQAQLYGLIDQLQEFGIELLAVEPADSSDGGSEPGLLPGPGRGSWPGRR